MASKFLSKLQGQRILLLGGTSGMGYCVAEGALEQGATVVISSSKQDKVESKVAELQKTNPNSKGRVFGKACDLSDLQDQEQNIVALLDFATENNTKKLDHIINSTGDGLHNPAFAELTVDIIQRAQPVRVIAPLMLAKHAPTYLNRAPSSSIIFTGGSGTYKPAPGWTLMPVVGGMLDALVRVLAVDLAPIRVNGIAPGPVMTEAWGGGLKLPADKANEIAEGVKNSLLTGQMGTPEDLAEAYLYLMKDRFVTGRMNVSDGGSLLK